MRAWFERFFSREWQRRSGWQILLQPLSWFFAAVTAIRRAIYQNRLLTKTNVGVPVIIVGNISVGGTGKTPLTVALANALLARGFRAGIVTRGYVADGGRNYKRRREQSDEATLMAARCAAPVVANRQRVLAAQMLLAEKPAINAIISDDGLQHYALERDLEIAVIDGARGLGNGYLLPAGPLRESTARLSTVDCIVVNNTNLRTVSAVNVMSAMSAMSATNTSNGAAFEAKNAGELLPATSLANLLSETGKPIFDMRYGYERFSTLSGNENLSAEQFLAIVQDKGADGSKRVAAVAGIGNPDRFFAHLTGLGISLASRHAFPDHHPFVAADLANIDAEIILMTEKDAVKCAVFVDNNINSISHSKQRLWQMQIDAVLPEAFYDFIVHQLNRRKKN